eukprot:1211004-Prymnesium_polylepis.1
MLVGGRKQAVLCAEHPPTSLCPFRGPCDPCAKNHVCNCSRSHTCAPHRVALRPPPPAPAPFGPL